MTPLSSVQFSHSVVSDSLWPPWTTTCQASPCPSPTPRVYSNSCPWSQWCHPTISSSVIPFSSCLQSFPASGSFQMSQFFTWGGQSIGVSASASVFSNKLALPIRWPKDWSFSFSPSNEYSGLVSFRIDWFYLLAVQWTVFFSTINRKHQFFCIQTTLWSNSHIHTWLLENHSFDYMDLCWQSDVSDF